MSRIKSAWLCVVALFAIGLMGATGASAAPQWYECAKTAKNAEGKYTGKWANKACTEGRSEGKYELKAGIGKGKGFKGKAKAPAIRSKSSLGVISVECASAKDEGKIAAPNKVYALKVTFLKCHAFGVACSSAGAKAGEVKSATLAGELGYINKPGVRVGLDLAKEGEPGGVLEEFECPGFFHVKSTGSLIGEVVKDINVVDKEVEFLYVPGEYLGKLGEVFPLENVPQFEGGPLDFVEEETCGQLIEEAFHRTCEVPFPVAQELKGVNKGERLMIKA